MSKDYDVEWSDNQDTILDDTTREEDIGETDEETVIPGGEDHGFENVVRDTRGDKEEFVSEGASEPFVSVQYNHKKRDFTKEEAISFIQKGMHTESLRTKLEYLAKKQNTDINTLVQRLVSAEEDAHREYLEQIYGADSENVETGMAIYRERQSDEYKRIMENEREESEEIKRIDDINRRLADEYMVMKGEMPDAPEYSDLPDSVIKEAAGGKRDLHSAYLHYLYKERLRIESAKKTEEAAKNASLGMMSESTDDGLTSSDRNFLLGLWSK